MAEDDDLRADVPFTMRQISVPAFSYVDAKALPLNDNVGTQFQFSLRQGVDQVEELMRLNLKTQLLADAKSLSEGEESIMLAEIVTQMEFGELEVKSREGRGIVLPTGHVVKMLDMLIGVTRGILSERLQGTPYAGAIMPSMDPIAILDAVEEKAEIEYRPVESRDV